MEPTEETFPRWKFHHTCPEGKIFQRSEDVPEGWVSGPHLIHQDPPTPNGTARDLDLLGGNLLEEDVTLRKRGRPPRIK